MLDEHQFDLFPAINTLVGRLFIIIQSGESTRGYTLCRLVARRGLSCDWMIMNNRANQAAYRGFSTEFVKVQNLSNREVSTMALGPEWFRINQRIRPSRFSVCHSDLHNSKAFGFIPFTKALLLGKLNLLLYKLAWQMR